MANNFANFNAAFPPGGVAQANAGRAYNAAPMTMAAPRTSGPAAVGSMASHLQLRPHEQQLFDSLFYSCEGSRTLGVVSGAAIKTLFTQSRLPKQTLATVWTLSDRQKRRVLDLDDFYIACRLIAIAQQNLPITFQSLKAYQEIPLPQFEGNSFAQASGFGGGLPQQQQQQQQPPQLQQAAAAPRKHAPPMTSVGGGLGSSMSLHAGSRGMDLLGASPAAGSASFPVSLGRSGSFSGPAQQSPAAPLVDEWSMTDTEKTQYVSLFSQADNDGDGFVGGKEANVFFKQSGLDNATLKKIWLLADVDGDNRLNPEEFAIAMHLTLRVRKQQALPAVLPASIDPRRQHASPAPSAGGESAGAHKPRVNLDLFPELLPTPVASQPQPDLLGFDSSAPGAARPSSKPSSRRASADLGFGGAQTPQMSQRQPSLGYLGPGGPVAGNALSPATPMQFGGGTHFNGATPIAASPQSSQPAQGYQIIEATQAIEDRTAHLKSLPPQVDAVQRQQAITETRLEEKLKALELVESQVQQQESVLAQQRQALTALEEQAAEAEAKFTASREKLATTQAEVKSCEARARQLTDDTAQLKRDTTEADMSLALLESQLTSLRSNLKGVEDLKENQSTILQARREQQNRLLLEKADVADLLAASKAELQQIKEQAAIVKDSLQGTQESIDEMQEMLKEHREIVHQERIKPSPRANLPPAPIPTPVAAAAKPIEPIASAVVPPPAVERPATSRVKAAVAAFNFNGDDDAYNIDDIPLPPISARPTTASATTPTSQNSATAASSVDVDIFAFAMPSEAAPVSAPVVAAAPPAPVVEAAAVPSVVSPQVISPAVFGDELADDDWGIPSSLPVATTAAVTAPPAAEPAAQSPFAVEAAASVPLPSSSSPAVVTEPEVDPFGAPASTLTLDSDVSPSSAAKAASPALSLTSPVPPAAPQFPSALEGTGVPDFDDASSNPWADDEPDADPFAISAPASSATGALSPQAAFGEIEDEDDPFGAPPAHVQAATSGAPQTVAVADDPFGSTVASAALTSPQSSTSVPPPIPPKPKSRTASSIPAAATATASFDDFADFGSDFTAVSSPAAAAAVAPVAANQAAVSASFDAAMAEDWAAFD